MNKSSFAVASAAAFLVATVHGTPAAAAPAKVASNRPSGLGATPADTAPKSKSPPNFDAMLTLVDKLFPPQPDPDPERLALARTSTEAMWPNGAYGKMMTGFVGGMFDRVMLLKTSDLAALSNKPGKPVTASKDVSLHEQVARKDPYFDQRMAAMRDALNEEMAKISAILDPRMREGFARAMARRFEARQLRDINIFFATPAGHAFAGQYMQLWLDPDTMRSIFSSMPEMMKLMPEMTQRLKAAEDRFPKPAGTTAATKKP